MFFTTSDASSLRFLDPVQGQKISTSAVQCPDGSPLRVCLATPNEPLLSPWHPDTLQQESNKVNLTLMCPPELRKWVEDLETKAQASVKLPAKAQWHSVLKQMKNGEWAVKLKMSLPGKPHPVQCWDTNRLTAEFPANLSGSTLVPIVTVRHVWQTAIGAGIAMDCTHLMLCEMPSATCPFQFEADF